MGNPGCPRCGRVVALLEGRPFVSTTGVVELWHRACFDVRDQPIVEPTPEPPPISNAPAPRRRARYAGASAGIIIAFSVVGWATAATPSAAIANIDVTAQEAIAIRGSNATNEIVPPRVVAGASEFLIPTISDVPIDRVYPSLRGWIHPVSATTERVPERHSRRFGSTRIGIERSECGAGHCGVDLDGPRGRPIVAVAAGTIVRVERSELGADGKSGRYVRIEHDDGTLTAYMHLDDVAHELRVGDRVDAGQYVGTLGATAVYNTVPHLHFALEIPDRPGVRGDHTETEYVDPAPFLARARISPMPERRTKPAS